MIGMLHYHTIIINIRTFSIYAHCILYLLKSEISKVHITMNNNYRQLIFRPNTRYLELKLVVQEGIADAVAAVMAAAINAAAITVAAAATFVAVVAFAADAAASAAVANNHLRVVSLDVSVWLRGSRGGRGSPWRCTAAEGPQPGSKRLTPKQNF